VKLPTCFSLNQPIHFYLYLSSFFPLESPSACMSLLDLSGELQILITDFLGFSPSRFRLRSASQSLSRSIPAEVYLEPEELNRALDRQLVNAKFIRSKSLDVFSLVGNRSVPIIFFEDALRRGAQFTARELETLMDAAVEALNGYVFNEVLTQYWTFGKRVPEGDDGKRVENWCSKIASKDAAEWIDSMLSVFPNYPKLPEFLRILVIAFKAKKCAERLSWVSLETVRAHPLFLEALVVGDDWIGIEQAFHTTLSPDNEAILRALKRAIKLKKLKFACFLREHMRGRLPRKLFLREYKALLNEVFPYMYDVDYYFNREIPAGENSFEFMNWLFGIVPNINKLEFSYGSALADAVELKDTIACKYLLDRGATGDLFCASRFKGGQADLETFVELCCATSKESWTDDSKCDLFLVECLITIPADSTIVQQLKRGYLEGCFSDRVAVIKTILERIPKSAKQFDIFCYSYCVSPLGALSLFAEPRRNNWTDKLGIFFNDDIPCVSQGPKGDCDEWDTDHPAIEEIEALAQIRSLLLAHGADPSVLFAPHALIIAFDDRLFSPSVKGMARMIEGKADVNSCIEGETPLEAAMRHSKFRTEQAVFLIQRGAEVKDEIRAMATAHNIDIGLPRDA